MSLLSLTHKEFTASARERAIIWIDPRQIGFHVGTKWPVTKRRVRQARRYLPTGIVKLAQPALRRREPFLIPGDLFGRSTPMEKNGKYRKVADFIEHKDNVTESFWYRDLMQDVRTTGRGVHKNIVMHSQGEVIDFLTNYVGGLIDSLLEKGFSEADSHYESTAVINQDGGLVKTGSGNHRFNICRVLGITPFPLKVVGAHRDWVSAQDGTEDATFETLLGWIATVEARHR